MIAPSALATMAMFAAVMAAPQPAQTGDADVAAREQLQLGTAIHGALDLPTTIHDGPKPTKAPAANFAAAGASQMTVTVINQQGSDITTVHVNGAGPAPSGNPGAGTIRKGDKASFVVGAGWNGNVAINVAGKSATTGDESLIEGSFVNQGAGYAQGDLNISFVNGFSVPIVCWCDANNVTTGCNKNLFSLHQCPANNGQGSCKNPLRADRNAKAPTEFFAPCHAPGGAYTFPSDDKANNLNAKCPSEKYTCCVGTSCRNNP